MEWAIIGTWKMALEGIEKATDILRNKGSSGDAVEYAIIAEKAGAHRIELNNATYLGGLTPSLGTIELVVENC